MKKVQPRVPSGFHEFNPAEQIILEQLKNQICRSFESFGFGPVETPAAELKEVILAKGHIDSKQIYTISRLPGEQDLSAALEDLAHSLDEGRLEESLQNLPLKQNPDRHAPDAIGSKLLNHIQELVKRSQTDMALHFDLTMPVARFVTNHKASLVFPFRRYQMQKVWRGERPQDSRFREFYQCDIDVIGRGSLDTLFDAEIPSIIYRTFQQMKIGAFIIRISNTKILEEYLRSAGIQDDRIIKVKSVLDDLEKVGIESTMSKLSEVAGISFDQSRSVIAFLTDDTSSSDEMLEKVKNLKISDRFQKGVEELSEVIRGVRMFGVPEEFFRIDMRIARGLDYYTGTIYETVLVDYPGIGSICSGGRYDDLASHFGDEKFPGVGISIGLTRLFKRLLLAGLIKTKASTVAPVLVTVLDLRCMNQYIRVANDLRMIGINTEMYLKVESLGKQLRYANRKGFQVAIVAGEMELARGVIAVKDLIVGNGIEIPIDVAAETIKKILGAVSDRE